MLFNKHTHNAAYINNCDRLSVSLKCVKVGNNKLWQSFGSALIVNA
jgi:hypothetical protein